MAKDRPRKRARERARRSHRATVPAECPGCGAPDNFVDALICYACGTELRPRPIADVELPEPES